MNLYITIKDASPISTDALATILMQLCNASCVAISSNKQVMEDWNNTDKPYDECVHPSIGEVWECIAGANIAPLDLEEELGGPEDYPERKELWALVKEAKRSSGGWIELSLQYENQIHTHYVSDDTLQKGINPAYTVNSVIGILPERFIHGYISRKDRTILEDISFPQVDIGT